jgi:cytochrome c biogenesis protein CcmG/thiol:disulfide interchange protein DsbE
MSRLKLFIPLLVFVVLAGFFFIVQEWIGAGRYDPQNMPSALLDKPLPAFQLPDLLSEQPVTAAQLQGQVALVNVWATWCPTCHYEHPYLNQLAAQGVVIFGVNYKDDPAKARQWLQEKGNPYRAVIDDRAGQLGLDLGVTGAPETYVIDRAGVVRLRYQGAVDARVWQETLQPLVERLQGEASGPAA